MSGWAPIVYGRTRRTDKWWRVLPEGVTTRHWAAQAVQDAVSGGAGLVRFGGDGAAEPTPRFVLARGVDGTLLGVACRANLLSDDLHQEENGREIYSFVGWFNGDPGTEDLPSLAAFGARLPDWAGAVYEERTRPVWNLHPARFSLEESLPAPAPWSGLEGEPRRPGALQALRREVQVHPSGDAERLWDYGIGSAPPFTLVTGWQNARDATLDRVSHLCADDITEPALVPRPVPPPPPPSPPRPAPGPADAREPEEPLPDARRGRHEEPDLGTEIKRAAIGLIKDLLGLGGRSEDRPPRPTPRKDGLGGDPQAAQRRIDELHRRKSRSHDPHREPPPPRAQPSYEAPPTPGEPSSYGPSAPYGPSGPQRRGEPPASYGPSGPQRGEEPSGSSASRAAASAGEEASGPGVPAGPPVEAELPERRGTKKLLEGLDD